MRSVGWRGLICCGCPFTQGQVKFLVSYLILYLFAILYCRWYFYRDPGSFFFDPEEGYRPLYSLTRVEQARSFIKLASNGSITRPGRPHGHTAHATGAGKTLCIGMATVKRPSRQYVDVSLGSLLADLTPDERASIYLNLLFAHTDPKAHPFSEAPWVPAVADNVLTYEKAGYKLPTVRRLEKDKRIEEKSLFDYKFLLRSCYELTDAPWIAILEDDVLAQEGWYGRTMAGLQKIQRQKKGKGDWLYLRLFYTEKFMGWNSEEWPVYLFWSLVAVSVPALGGLYLRGKIPSLRNTLSDPFLAVICLVCVPAAIVLYFLAGRVSVQPLHSGVRPMNRYACCSQGLVFPREIVPRLIHGLGQTEQPRAVDSAIEAWADREGLQRWALVPSVMQHIGGKTYKKTEKENPRDKFEVSGARGLWNFRFELHENLRRAWDGGGSDERQTGEFMGT